MFRLTNETNGCLTPRMGQEGAWKGIEAGRPSDRRSMVTSRGSDFTRTPVGNGDGDVVQ